MNRPVQAFLGAVVLCLLSVPPLAAGPMAFPGRDWQDAPPQAQGVDPGRLARAVADLKARLGRDGTSEMVIVRRGVMIWKGSNTDKVHGVWSATKSFTSTVLGLLIDDEKCTLDTRACLHVPALKAAYPDVTLRHFTTMTSGYRAVGDEPQGTYIHGPSSTWSLPGDSPLFSPPGSRYAYWDSAMNELGLVLTRIAGEPMQEVFRRRIAEPIGMNARRWKWGDFGKMDGLTVNGGSGNGNKHVQISAREMARLGHLFLNRGRWDGRALISPKWVEQATAVQVPALTPPGQPQCHIKGSGVYGFNWWVNGKLPSGARKWPSAPPRTFAASGYNNNHCFVVPEWDMVIVRLGLDGNVDDGVWDAFFKAMAGALR